MYNNAIGDALLKRSSQSLWYILVSLLATRHFVSPSKISWPLDFVRLSETFVTLKMEMISNYGLYLNVNPAVSAYGSSHFERQCKFRHIRVTEKRFSIRRYISLVSWYLSDLILITPQWQTRWTDDYFQWTQFNITKLLSNCLLRCEFWRLTLKVSSNNSQPRWRHLLRCDLLTLPTLVTDEFTSLFTIEAQY